MKQAIGHQGPGAARPSMHTISQHRQPASRRRHDFAAEAAGTGQRAVGSLHRLHGGLDVHARAPRARATCPAWRRSPQRARRSPRPAPAHPSPRRGAWAQAGPLRLAQAQAGCCRQPFVAGGRCGPWWAPRFMYPAPLVFLRMVISASHDPPSPPPSAPRPPANYRTGLTFSLMSSMPSLPST